jgi:alpha-L-rhamnosidase
MTALPQPAALDMTTRVVMLRSQFDPRLLVVPLEPVRLRWTAASTTAAASQIGYQLRSRVMGDQWRDHPPIASRASIDVSDGSAALASREQREYAVRVATEDGWTGWSEEYRVEGGIASSEIVAVVIDTDSTIEGPVPTFRTEFTIDGDVARSRLYISALGVYTVRINGCEVTDSVLSPGWTSYQDRILLDTIDVSRFLVQGINAVAVTVADGWFRGRMGFAGRTAIYGDRIGALVQLEIDQADGSFACVISDESWRAGYGEIRSTSIYDGTTIDQRESTGDPSIAGFSDVDWSPVRTVPVDLSLFETRPVIPVRPVVELPTTLTQQGGVVRLDATQNIAGWLRLRVDGRAGDTIVIRHAEVLEPDGALHTAALRTAKATDTYILGSDGIVDLEPSFTFHGFRYAEVQLTGSTKVLEATAISISSDLTKRSTFSSSHAALDRFHENVRWSQRDNFISLPTDCPQRDERLGWTGDAQAFAPTANTLFDSEAFWSSWLRDLEADQTDEGGVASVVPNIIRHEDMMMLGTPTNTLGRAGWADAATIVPFAVYDSYGDPRILRSQLRSMQRWVAHLRTRAGRDLLVPREPFQYGDWLDPDAPGDRPWDSKVSSDFVANAFYVRSMRLLARAEGLVGDPAAASELLEHADRVAGATWDLWSDQAISTQTGGALAIEFGIAPHDQRSRVADALAESVRSENGRIATGFLGTPLVLFALSNTGHLEEAFQMLLRRDAPSWLYQVDMGATTVWERWDAIRPDGSIHSGKMDTTEGDSMISFNHYAYGAMVDWVYRTVAGLAPLSPGYERTRVAPRPASALTQAQASIATRFGELAIAWHLDADGDFVAQLTIPFGVEAELDLPTTASSVVTVNVITGASPQRLLRHGQHRVRVTFPAVVCTDAPAF